MPNPEYLEIIEHAAEDFADHEKMTLPRVIRWFDQFSTEHQYLAASVLNAIDYYSTSRIRGMTRDLVHLVMQRFEDVNEENIYFVPVGGVYESSHIIARALRDEKREQGSRWSVCSLSEVESLKPDDVDVILVVDDFSGTANSLEGWWEEIEPLILPKQSVFGICLLVVNYLAIPVIQRFADVLIFVNELDNSYNSFSETSRYFTSVEDRNLLHYYCEKTGASSSYVRGYGDCGLLIAFKHGCPNNSLPILWWNSDKWHPLFQRYGL